MIERRITPISGRYSFQLEAGQYTVFVAKEGYVPLSALPSMTSDDVKIDVRLVRPGNGSLSGKAMKSGDKSPFQGVTVNLRSGWYTQNASVVQTTSTDANGQYSFPSLNNRYYTVELRKSGYDTATFNVTVSRNVTGRDYYMSEGGNPEEPEVRIVSYNIPIDEPHFPDAVFREYVRRFDTNSDGTLSAAEIAMVTGIYVSDSGISSLQGVEYFTALQYLNCYNNQLTTLDLSNCPNLNISNVTCDSGVSITWPSINTSSTSAVALTSGQSVSASSTTEILATLPSFTPSQSGTYTFTASRKHQPPEDTPLLFFSNSEDINVRFTPAISPDWVSVPADLTAGRTYHPVIAAGYTSGSSGGCNSGTLGIIFMAGVAFILAKRLYGKNNEGLKLSGSSLVNVIICCYMKFSRYRGRRLDITVLQR